MFIEMNIMEYSMYGLQPFVDVYVLIPFLRKFFVIPSHMFLDLVL